MAESHALRRPRSHRPTQALPLERPLFRRLQAYAFDPSVSVALESTTINHVTLNVPWDVDGETNEDILGPGPVGEYVEVVDIDPASGCVYAPVDLDAADVLADTVLYNAGHHGSHNTSISSIRLPTRPADLDTMRRHL
jgi:hypothetical protein